VTKGNEIRASDTADARYDRSRERDTAIGCVPAKQRAVTRLLARWASHAAASLDGGRDASSVIAPTQASARDATSKHSFAELVAAPARGRQFGERFLRLARRD
jgi:hypothetical protein